MAETQIASVGSAVAEKIAQQMERSLNQNFKVKSSQWDGISIIYLDYEITRTSRTYFQGWAEGISCGLYMGK